MPKKKEKRTPNDYHTKYLTITLVDGSKKKLKFYGKTEKEAIKKETQQK